MSSSTLHQKLHFFVIHVLLWWLLILISTPWPAWFPDVADALLHSAMSRPLEMPPWRPSPWQPLCLWHQYHHSTANGKGRERMRALTLSNPVVQFRRRCNLCNLGDYARQDEHNDFWFNKQVKHSCTLLLVALELISMFIIKTWRMHLITELLLHVGSHVLHPHIFQEIDWLKRAQTPLLKPHYTIWMCCGLWGEKTVTVMSCKVTFAEVVRRLWLYLLELFLYQSILASVKLPSKSAHMRTVMSTTLFESSLKWSRAPLGTKKKVKSASLTDSRAILHTYSLMSVTFLWFFFCSLNCCALLKHHQDEPLICI